MLLNIRPCYTLYLPCYFSTSLFVLIRQTLDNLLRQTLDNLQVWPYEENDEYGFVQGLFGMMRALFSREPENHSFVQSVRSLEVCSSPFQHSWGIGSLYSAFLFIHYFVSFSLFYGKWSESEEIRTKLISIMLQPELLSVFSGHKEIPATAGMCSKI